MGYNIGPTVAVKGESDFNKALAQIKTNMKLIASEAGVMTAQFKGNENSLVALTAKGKLLNTSMQEQKRAVKEAEDALKRMESSGVKPTDRAYVEMKTNLNNAKAALVTTTNEIKENEAALKRGGRETQNFSEGWHKFASGAAAVGAGALRGLAVGIGAIAAGAALAITKIFEMTTASGKWADELLTTSAQTDVSAQTLQEWSYASRFIDTSVEDMNKGMAKVVMGMKTATEGGKSYIDVAGGLKIAMKNQDGSMKSTEQVFYDTIDALGGIEDATKRDIAAQDIFGKSYQDIKPLIDAGSEALLKYAAEAHNAGLILSDEAVKALGSFDDQMERVNAKMDTAGRLAALVFLPAVSGIVDGFADILSTITTALADGFQESDIKTISDAITEQLQSAISAIADNAPAFIGVVVNVLNTIVEMMVELIPTLLPVLVDAGIQLFTGFLETIQQNAAAIGDTVVKIVTMFATFIIENLPMVIETGMTLILAVAQGLAENLPEMIPAIIGMVNEIALILTDPATLSQLIVAALQIVLAIAQGIIENIPALVQTSIQVVINIAQALIDAAPQLWESGKEFFVQVGQGIWDQLSVLFTQIGDWINTNIIQPVKDKVGEFRSIGSDMIAGIWNGISDKIAWLKSQVGNLVNIIKGWFTGKDGFDEHSPSKWGVSVGSNLLGGVGIGVDEAAANAIEIVSNSIRRIKSTVSSGLSNVFGEKLNEVANILNLTRGSAAETGTVQAQATAPVFAPTFNIYAKDKDTAVEAADATLAAFQRARWVTT